VEMLSSAAAGPRHRGRSCSPSAWAAARFWGVSLFGTGKMMVLRSHSQAVLGTTPPKNHQTDPGAEQPAQGCAPCGCRALPHSPICGASAFPWASCTDTLPGTAGRLTATAPSDSMEMRQASRTGASQQAALKRDTTFHWGDSSVHPWNQTGI